MTFHLYIFLLMALGGIGALVSPDVYSPTAAMIIVVLGSLLFGGSMMDFIKKVEEQDDPQPINITINRLLLLSSFMLTYIYFYARDPIGYFVDTQGVWRAILILNAVSAGVTLLRSIVIKKWSWKTYLITYLIILVLGWL